MNQAKLLPFRVLTIALALFLLCPNLVRDGMFVDGLWYAAISHNLAQGLGTPWEPHFSATVFPQFHEHPPLLFWVQSLFFQMFGGGIFTERFYCVLVIVLSIFALHWFWKFIFQGNAALQRLSFLPILFWLLNEDVVLSYPNNLLECTLSLFTFAAVFILLIFCQKDEAAKRPVWRWVLLPVASGLILLALLTKGPVGLFPLAFFGAYWLAFRRMRLSKALFYSIILSAYFVLFLLLFLQIPEAKASLNAYFDHQVMAALQGERTENIRTSHFYILKRLFEKNLIAIGITIGLWLLLRYLNIFILPKKDRQWALLLLLVGVSASFPLIISIKQASYYLVPSLPFYSLALAIIISRGVSIIIDRIKLYTWQYFAFISMLFLFLAYALFYTFTQIGKTDKRDVQLLADVHTVSRVVPRGAIIGCKMPRFSPPAHGYFQRYYQISLDEQKPLSHHYLLISNALSIDTISNFYKIELPLHQYHLYVVKN